MDRIRFFKTERSFNKYGNIIQMLFVSKRLAWFMYEQSLKGKWLYNYFLLKPMKYGDFEFILVSSMGLLIGVKKNNQ